MKAARQQAIVDLLLNHTSLTTEALALQLNVSKKKPFAAISMNYRRRVKCYAIMDALKLSTVENQDSGDPFHIRLKSHYAHKADIAREALA